jgi:uncharacterized protein YciI
MKHYVIEIIYTASIEKIEEIRQEHRNFLKSGYDKKVILMSGPQVPRIGGMIIARSESMEVITEFFKNDPYQINGLAEYKYIEFKPVNFQKFLNDWLQN